MIADYSDADRRLRLELPDGEQVEDVVRLGGPVVAQFYSGILRGQLVDGPWSDAISEFAGRPLRLVEAGDAPAPSIAARSEPRR